MKAIIEAKALASAVGRVAPFIPRSHGLAAVGGIHIEADGGEVIFTATSIEHSARTRVAAEVSEPGKILVPGGALRSIAPKLGGAVTVALGDGTADLVAGDVEFTLRLLPEVEFPRLDWPTAGLVELGERWDIVERVALAASRDMGRLNLTNVMFGDDAIAATDSYRLHWSEGWDGPDGVVPLVPLLGARKALDGQVSMAIGERSALLTDGTTDVATRLHDGEVPRWRGLVRSSSTHVMVIDAPALADALDVVAALPAEQGAGGAVRLSLDGNVATLARYTSDVGRAEVTVPAGGSWPCTIGVQAGFLSDALRALAGEQVAIGAVDANKPMVILGDPVSALIMPVRLNTTHLRITDAGRKELEG